VRSDRAVVIQNTAGRGHLEAYQSYSRCRSRDAIL